MLRRMGHAGWILAATLVLGAPGAPAQGAPPCRLALALAIDVSRSVDDAAYALQVTGVAGALFDPEVRALMLHPSGTVAVAVYEWSGRREQRLVTGWRVIATEDDIDRLAAAVVRHERSFRGLTAVGAALSRGRRLMARAPDCDWQVIDISGDGRNNDGPDPAQVYAREDFGDITVNGLAIGGWESDILRWYRAAVIRGPGAFAEYAERAEDFPDAFRRKLVRELDPRLFGGAPGP